MILKYFFFHSFFEIDMGIPVDELKKKFPSLSKEIEQNEMSVSINSVRVEAGEENQKDPLRGYSPNVVDFLRRCNNLKEAEEIITFLEKRGELSNSESKKVHDQLYIKGLRSFGTKKEHGHYFRET